MSKANPPTCCCAAGAADITGCRMSLYPMCDDFVNIILTAAAKVDTAKVWAATDVMSTVYRGRPTQVLDCARAIFVNAYRESVHMAGEFTFSRGCPGDVDADRYLDTDDIPANSASLSLGDFQATAKISFYAFGLPEYMAHIRQVVALAQKHGLSPKSSHYVTFLKGTANSLFAYFDEVLAYALAHLPHYVLQASISVNSPTPEAL